MCFRVRERERERKGETNDEGEGDPTTTFATGAAYLGFSTFHIASQLLISYEIVVFCYLVISNKTVRI